MARKAIVIGAVALLVGGAAAAVAHGVRHHGYGGHHGGYHGERHGYGYGYGHDRWGRGGPRRGDRARRMERRFDEVDADGDGSVTRAEIDAWRAARFERIDANGDGALDAEELVRDRLRRRAERRIRRLDQNEDGVLQPNEMPDRMGRLFDRADLDENGAVTKTELRLARKRGRGDRDGMRRRWRGDGADRLDGPDAAPEPPALERPVAPDAE